MFRNILYYMPDRANRIFRAPDGSKEKKKLVAALAGELQMTNVQENDAIGRKVRRLMSAVLTLAAAIVPLAAAMELCDLLDIGGDALFVALFLTLMLFFIAVIVMAIRIVGLRRKRVLMLLETYRPVCEHFGENLLREIGSICAETIDNAENIVLVADEVENGSLPKTLAEGVCLMCGEKLNITAITEFDSDNSALCPCCGKRSVILKSRYVSEKLLNDMLEYCSAIRETERDKIYN